MLRPTPDHPEMVTVSSRQVQQRQRESLMGLLGTFDTEWDDVSCCLDRLFKFSLKFFTGTLQNEVIESEKERQLK